MRGGDYGARLIIQSGENVTEFDFSRQYVMWFEPFMDANPSDCDRELLGGSYNLVLEIVNHDSIYQEKLQTLLENLGVDMEQVTSDTDFIAVNISERKATVLDNCHTSGARADTVLGAFSIFYNDEGGYGVYMDGNECMVVQPQENEDVDVRASILSVDLREVVWCPTFSY